VPSDTVVPPVCVSPPVNVTVVPLPTASVPKEVAAMLKKRLFPLLVWIVPTLVKLERFPPPMVVVRPVVLSAIAPPLVS